MKNIAIIISIATLMTGCSSTDKMSSNDKEFAYSEYIATENLTSERRVNSFKLSAWKPLTDKFLVINTFKEQYLVEVSHCLHLEDAMDIKLKVSSSLVLTTNDSLFVLNTPDSSNFECQIKSIYPVTKEQSNLIESIGKA